MKTDPTKTHVAKEFAHGAPMINCRFDPSGKYLFGTAEDRAIIRWEVESGTKLVYPQHHDSWVRGIAFSKDGQTVVTSGYDDTLIWWPATAEKPEPIRKVAAHEGWIRTLAVSPDGTLLASAGNDRTIKLWKVADGSLVREIEGHERDVYSTYFHPDGQWLLSGDLKGKVHQWELSSGKLLRTFDCKSLNTYNGGQQVDYGGVRGIHLSADKKHLACAGLHKATNPLGAVSQPLFLRFAWDDLKVLKSHVADGVTGIGWNALFHPDGYLMGCAGGKSGAFLLFWKEGDEKAYHKFKLPGTAREFDLHPDGIQVATAHYEKKVTIAKLVAKG